MKLHDQLHTLAIEGLIPYARNSRTHSDEQVAQIAASIREFGFTNPVLVDEAGGIIAGHGRVLAARKLGLERVPCLRLEGLTEAQKRAYVIADNKLALNAGGDEQMLAIEIKELQGLEFDLGLLGFDAGELDELLALGDVTPEGKTDADALPEVQSEAVTRPGDVWVLGRHRLMCGDSTDAGTVALLMNGDKADMVYTDPPYGISIVSSCEKVGGDKPFGKVRTIHKGMKAKPIVKANIYAQVAGDDSIQVAIDAIAIIKKLDPSVQIIWGGNYYASHLPDSSCWIVWDKNNGESFFADAELAWTNQKTAVRIFKHTWNGLIKESEHGEKRVHPTQKPVALAEWCFEKYGNKKNTVLDLFGGSGSTLIACEKSGKTGYIMELAEQYVDVAVRRWQQFTGKTATLESTGEPFPG